MAEDEEFVRALEHAGVGFIGPRAAVHQGARGVADPQPAAPAADTSSLYRARAAA